MRIIGVVATLGLVAMATLVPVQSAQAVTASGGQRCTIVGTSGADHLTGTSGNDVICGLGGNDVISGGGGNDIIDAGAGNDRVSAGDGNDTVYAGSGNDVVSGGNGSDHLSGGSGDDVVNGDAGNDVASGGDGNDVVNGGPGNDVTYGDTGNDTLRGLSGNDVLVGSWGNDDLDGGTGTDSMIGGPGTNWCTLDPADTSTQQCVYDTAAPFITNLRLSDSTVDVSTHSVVLTAAMYVGDDTGVRSAQIGVNDLGVGTYTTSLVGGTVRRGWFRASFVIPQFTTAGTFDFFVNLVDRVGRSGGRTFTSALKVVDRHPDLAPPVVQAIRTTHLGGGFPVDVRKAEQTVQVDAHITDDMSGVHDGNAFVCLVHKVDTYYTNSIPCDSMTLLSGTAVDGIFRGSVPIPKGAASGDWNVEVWVSDAAHPSDQYYWCGPESYAAFVSAGPDPHYRELPQGAGRFPVLGVGDAQAPVVTSLRIAPSTIDTLPSGVLVGFDVDLTDDSGVVSVDAYLSAANLSSGWSATTATAPATGTATDGTWHLEIWVPQGVPPQTLFLQLIVTDSSHWHSYVSASSPYLDATNTALSPAQLGSGTDVVVIAPHA